ncbi:hypothetical protein NQ314_011985 [Rhamnusium bicolor]|uniref:PiggyBac transposable element-derived protein domain-containing protein n=1 Tax=Rhamnusium bicolor TaxID=1586634 RepID=A0AAV8XFN4_9CUCU|nr:hypothetical protein NQ314_011985 [Rhamnusium bicolor]
MNLVLILDLMDYEKEQQRLLKLFEECQTEDEYDDEEDSGEEDRVEERSERSDTEEDGEEVTDLSDLTNVPHFIGKDQKTKWTKHAGPKNVRTRKENLVMQLPGSKACVAKETDIQDIWNSLFDTDMLQIIVNTTNTKIEAEKHKFSTLIGLLYLAGIRKASHLNTTDLWKTDGTGIEVFRLTMNITRFRHLFRYIRTDDINTRASNFR